MTTLDAELGKFKFAIMDALRAANLIGNDTMERTIENGVSSKLASADTYTEVMAVVNSINGGMFESSSSYSSFVNKVGIQKNILIADGFGPTPIANTDPAAMGGMPNSPGNGYSATDNALKSDLNPYGSIQKQRELDAFFNSIKNTSGNGGGGGDVNSGGGSAAPSQSEQLSEFYVKQGIAIDEARAGNPQKLRDFDNFFGIPRAAAEYTVDFYHPATSYGRIAAINSLDVSQNMKNDMILEVQFGNTDSVSNMVTYLNIPGNKIQDGAAALGNTTEGKINLINATNVSQNMKNDMILEVQFGNTDSVSNMITYLNNGNQIQAGAAALGNTPEGKTALVNAMNISQERKNQIILEVQSGNQDSVSNLVTWFNSGGAPSAGALALAAPPPAAVVAAAPVADTPPATVDVAPVDPSAETQEVTDDNPVEGVNGVDDVAVTAGQPEAPNQTAAEAQAQQDDKQAEGLAKAAASQAAAAQAKEDREAESALASATASKHSAKESRMKKLMSMRKPWSSGGSSSNGSDSMVAPPITPSSQIPPPPL